MSQLNFNSCPSKSTNFTSLQFITISLDNKPKLSAQKDVRKLQKSKAKKRRQQSVYKDEEVLKNLQLRKINTCEKQIKQEDLMTQITYQFKKLEFKDSRKRLEKSLKNRRKIEKQKEIDIYNNVQKSQKELQTHLQDSFSSNSIKPKCIKNKKQQITQQNNPLELPRDIIFAIQSYFSYEEQLSNQIISKDWFIITKFSLRKAIITSFNIPSITKKRQCSLVEKLHNLSLDEQSLDYSVINLSRQQNINNEIFPQAKYIQNQVDKQMPIINNMKTQYKIQNNKRRNKYQMSSQMFLSSDRIHYANHDQPIQLFQQNQSQQSHQIQQAESESNISNNNHNTYQMFSYQNFQRPISSKRKRMKVN